MKRRPTARELACALNSTSTIPRAAACLLAGCVPTWADADAGDAAELARRIGVSGPALAAALALRPQAIRLAAAESDRAAARGATLIVRGEDGYPERLLDLSLPPPALYCLGTLPAGPAVALVGSRRAEPWAVEAAIWLARELAAAGVVVVSGFARGVDAAAHRGVVEGDGGRTVAVLGCGLAIDYPRGQRDLARAIGARGALVSEFPLDTPPEPWRFPVRNRIIAALATAVVVVSAAPKSGSLVTARLALELGREVMAVPGRIFDETALGTNALLRDGAAPVCHPGDVLGALGLESRRPAGSRPAPPGPPPPPLVALLRDRGPLDADSLAVATGAGADELLGELLELELAGRVRRLPGARFEALA